MSSWDDLLAAYAVWRRWTESEAAAIAQADWPLLAECQRAKRMLQPTILELTKASGTEPSGDRPAPEEIRVVVAELITLEHSNERALAAQQANHRRRQAELNVTGRN